MPNLVRFSSGSDVEEALLKRTRLIQQIAPQYITPARLAALLNYVWSRAPALRECTSASLLFGALDAVLMGLEPAGTVQTGWLVPFRNAKTGQREATFIPGYGGLAKLAVWSGSVTMVKPVGVYERDVWSYNEATEEMRHEWPQDGERGNLVRVYASMMLPDGGRRYDVMTMGEVAKIRNASRASDTGPWRDWPEEMAKKCPVRRACKTLAIGQNPWGKRLERAVAADDRLEGGAIDDAIPQSDEAVEDAVLREAEQLGPAPKDDGAAPWAKHDQKP